ncbi:Putative uncharacterized protein [Taphrina deformans PYCC 5710]|uniref:Uncharacterized protein n=1 Tax=Taphrina deformans (strain PYCC 5710 / ATCC 11124 / CBS 356.35 / IMI 108563 / JCM 9778 / NBRC 8474) TaxID=1097556 RepID=R4XBQ4_TAPDE|nr:Putative uncharacterized protein [Taphrina deformans PYCC 5710]|eukprot:CCG81806.1 Putative uncharacterized protein [Taphrina deformans PYCC 5710]
MPLFSALVFNNEALKTLVPTIAAAFAIQAAVAIPSIWSQNEQYYDLSGSATFLACTALSLYMPVIRTRAYAASHGLPKPAFPSLTSFGYNKLVLSAMVAVWAGRLGTFLFARIKKAGKDPRFDDIKPKPLLFFGAFMAQATWVSLVAGPVFAVNAIPKASLPALGVLEGFGILVWLFGMSFEITADRQKSTWRAQKDAKKHSETFISSGLWSRTRHPNYFGESTLWVGMSIFAYRSLSKVRYYPSYAGYLAFVAPAFVTLLTQFVSGTPMLEKKNDKELGADWQEYKKKTPVFFPKLGL